MMSSQYNHAIVRLATLHDKNRRRIRRHGLSDVFTGKLCATGKSQSCIRVNGSRPGNGAQLGSQKLLYSAIYRALTNF